MSREDHGAVIGAFMKFFDENRAFFAQGIHYKLIVHNFVAHKNWCAPFLKRHFNDFDGAVDACAKPTRRGKVECERLG
jgi:hypothetical protein